MRNLEPPRIQLCAATQDPSCVATRYSHKHCDAMLNRVEANGTTVASDLHHSKSRAETATRIIQLLREIVTLVVLIAPWVIARL